ncbi:MAG TPA: Gfo/Idh/MocA family oxidoreductase, partial [Planctomycetaceae bacterium]|nr:Gfo/Idh/MocA family oxidoreductase [Planctomycetaceae bacterium]
PSKKKPPTYHDYRELLKQEQPEIVIIGTPDHWHALTMIEAVRCGAHVYVEKPISRDVLEGQAMLAAARKYNRVVQVGTQRRSTPHIIEAIDRVVKEGLLGTVGHIEICCYFHMRVRKAPPNTDPPPYLDWNFWTGPAPMRPYNPVIHPGRWRSFTEYGNGIVGDMCIHMLDMVRWMLGLGWPKRIWSAGGIYVDKASIANVSDTQTATFEFDDLSVVWTHRTWGHPVDRDYPWAATLYGDKGTLKVSVLRYDFTPFRKGKRLHGEALYEPDKYPEEKNEARIERHAVPAVRRHMLNFLAAIESGGRPVADIEQGYISSACCILANLAMKLGRTLSWDPESGTVLGDEEANQLLARTYRKPWVHPRPQTV